jgi:hypothetical protein
LLGGQPGPRSSIGTAHAARRSRRRSVVGVMIAPAAGWTTSEALRWSVAPACLLASGSTFLVSPDTPFLALFYRDLDIVPNEGLLSFSSASLCLGHVAALTTSLLRCTLLRCSRAEIHPTTYILGRNKTPELSRLSLSSVKYTALSPDHGLGFLSGQMREAQLGWHSGADAG